MLRKFTGKIANVFRWRGENFTLIYEGEEGFWIAEARIDEAGKRIQVNRIVKDITGSVVERVRRTGKGTNVLALGSAHATTIESMVELRRQRPEDGIDEAELDTLLFRGLWEFLNRYRGWSAKKMGVNELDLVLVEIGIIEVRIGTHRMFNPLGFSGRSFSIRMRGTFIPRAFLELFALLKKKMHNLSIVENLAAIACLQEGEYVLAHIGRRSTDAFVSREKEKCFVKRFPWGIRELVGAISELFAIREEVAESVLMRYARNELSSRAARLVERACRPQVKKIYTFLAPLREDARGKNAMPIHFLVRFSFPLPFFPGAYPFSVRASREDAVRYGNFEINGIGRNESIVFCEDILGPFFYRGEDYSRHALLNQILQRRARWLIPHFS